MQGWHGEFLGRRRLPRALSGFELEAFFTFTGAERRAIEQRRTAALRLGLALQVGFLRMSGRPLAAVGDALGLLANLVMAWNTAQMQAAFDRLNARKSTAVPPELIGRIARTRTEGLNLRGVFRFPAETYAEQLLANNLRKAAARTA